MSNDDPTTTSPATTPPTIDSMLSESGIAAITQGAANGDVESALRRLADLARGADGLRMQSLREAATTQLEAAGVRGAVRLVDAALTSVAPSDGDTVAGRTVEFSDPEPWPTPVDGAALLDEIVATVRRFVIFPNQSSAVAAALWVLRTWGHNAFTHSPLLHITAPEKRCGKSILLDVIACMVRRPLRAAHATVAALFRAIETFGPTVLLDEADTYLRDNQELRGLLDSAHSRSGAQFLRTAGQEFAPRQFSTWAPFAVAGIGELPGTARDRAVRTELRRKLGSDRVERLRADRLMAELEPLRRRAVRWIADNAESLADADPDVPDALNDREADSWRPLLAVADAAGGSWGVLARSAAVALSAPRETSPGDSFGVELLRDVREVFGTSDRVTSFDLVDRLNAMVDRPWPEFCRGRELTQARLAGLLRPYGIAPRTIRVGDATPRGYLRESFDDAWTRYLPPEAETPPQARNDLHAKAIESRNTSDAVALSDRPESEQDIDLLQRGGAEAPTPTLPPEPPSASDASLSVTRELLRKFAPQSPPLDRGPLAGTEVRESWDDVSTDDELRAEDRQ